MSLQGRNALVTGGSRGIGRAICLELARQGANVAVNYAGNAQAAEETAAACRELGVETVSVYSQADADALHVQLASQAVCIGPAKASDSYLNVDALLTVAKETGCDAVHPGYGFLSENADFSDRFFIRCANGEIPDMIFGTAQQIDISENPGHTQLVLILAVCPVAPF